MTRSPGLIDETPSFAPPDGLTRLALGYLALPLFLYFPGWYKPLPALILTALLGYAMWRATRSESPVPTPWPAKPLLALAAIVAIGWSVFGGAGHFFYANAHDWLIRDAVLRDLVAGHWPPAYDVGEADAYVLRAPVAYYLPAAAIAKLTGLATADKLLWLWTVIGVTAFFLLLPLRHTTLPRAALALVVVVLFSGMDILGLMFPDFHEGNMPFPWAFIDWWIRPPPMVSYWSNTSNLFWNPNHCLPAWISIALFYRHWRHQDFLKVAMLLVAILPLWSPFALIGLAPFVGMLALRWWYRRASYALDIPLAAASIAIFGVIFAALVIPTTGIRYGMSLTTPPEYGDWVYLNDLGHILTYLENYTLFVIFEFAVIALLVARLIDRWLFATAVATLFLLPLFSLGPGNDLAMRASIPSLAILCIAAVNAILRPDSGGGPFRRAGLALVLMIGAVTPYHEFYRAIYFKPWSPNLDFNLTDANNGRLASHYLVERNRTSVAALLNEPTTMTNAVDWRRYCMATHPRLLENRSSVIFAWRANRNDEDVRNEKRIRDETNALQTQNRQ